MAIYEFKCDMCHKVTEKIVKIGTETVECPNCGSIAHKQVSLTGGFQLKGGGWFKQTSGPSTE